MPFTDEQIQEAKSKSPEAIKLTAEPSGVEIIVRPASRVDYQRFTATFSDSDAQKRASAGKQLVADCLLVPSRLDLEAIEARYPGILWQFATDIRKLAGAAEEIRREKL